MENHRDRFVMIFAGYTREMQAFLAANSGIKSRIGYTVFFPDYTPDELVEIFVGMAAEGGYAVPEDVRDELRVQFAHLAAAPGFGNARDVRVQFYQRMQDEADRRLYEALQAGEEPESFARVFTVEDVRGAAPERGPSAAAIRERTRLFRVGEIAAAQQQQPPLSAEAGEQDLLHRLVQTVGFIVADDDKSGTGFVISPEGHMLTAYHVVEGARVIRFRPDGAADYIEATYLDGDREADLAVLKIGGGRPFAKLVPPDYVLRLGTPLGLLGYPMGETLGTEITYTSGPLSSKRTSEQDVRRFQIDVSAYAGNSGGPVFLTQTGEVIGVLVFGPSDTMNFAVSVEELYRRFK